MLHQRGEEVFGHTAFTGLYLHGHRHAELQVHGLSVSGRGSNEHKFGCPELLPQE
jgi:hypothetical protein